MAGMSDLKNVSLSSNKIIRFNKLKFCHKMLIKHTWNGNSIYDD